MVIKNPVPGNGYPMRCIINESGDVFTRGIPENRCERGDELAVKEVTVTYKPLPTPNMSGYTFLEWFSEESVPIVDGYTREEATLFTQSGRRLFLRR